MNFNEVKSIINEKMFQLLFGSLSIEEIENWIYQSDFLKKVLSEDEYLELIEIDYRNKTAKYEIEKFFKPYLNYGYFEKIKILNLINKALKRDEKLPYILIDFYELYCHGYYFLQNIALSYGLLCKVPSSEEYVLTDWNNLKENEKKKILNNFYPQLNVDLKQILNWIKNEKIILTGKKNMFNHWEYIDFRTEHEKKLSSIL